MPTMTVLDTPFVTVWYHPETKIVHSRIHKFVSGKEFQDFLLAGWSRITSNTA
jgi:hypothetical protein